MNTISVKRSFSFAQVFQFTSQPVCLITALYVLPASVLKQGAIDFQCLALLYFASFFVYNADRLWANSPEDEFNHPERSEWIRQYKTPLSFLCIVSGIITFYIIVLHLLVIFYVFVSQLSTFLFLRKCDLTYIEMC